jgi:hypothetical protein
MVLEDVDIGENGAKMWVAQNYSPTRQKLDCEINIYELEDHVGEEGLSLNLLLKHGRIKKLFLQVFLITY